MRQAAVHGSARKPARRSDRIRSRSLPQGRLGDHRINLTLYKLAQIMDGDLSELLLALAHAHEAEQLQELEDAAA